MKKVLAVLVLLGAGFAHAQVIGLNPTPQAEYYWNTTTNQWTACTNSSTAEPFQSLPQAFVQEGFNTSLGRWTPVTQCTTSGGGASITVNMGSPLTSPVNFQNSGGAGEINFTNPTDSNVQATLANAYTLINGVNCPLGPAGCALPPYCAGPTCANLDQNNPGFTTGVLTTTAAITSTSLVIPVASTAGFPSTGCGWTAPVVEAICWDSITPTSLVLNTLTNRRGTNGYGANSHVLGSTIEGNVFSLALSATTAQLQAISTGNQLAFNNAINPGLAQNNVFGGNTLFEAQAQVSGKLTVGGGLVITGNSPILNSLSNTAGTQLVNCAPHGTPSGLFCNDEGNWVAAGGGLTGLTTGLYPVATSATTVGNGHIDEITNVGQVTSTLPLYVNPTDGNDQTSLVVSGELTGQTSTIFDVDNFSGSIYLSVQGDGSNDEPGWVTITNGIELGGGSFLGGEGPNNSICGSFDTLPSEGTINCITYSGSGMAITSGSVGSFVPIITFGTSISSAVPSPQLTLTPTGLELNYLTPSTSPLCYPAGSPAVVTNVGCTGGGLSGLTTGFFPIATSSTTVGNSLLDYNVTNPGYFTFGAPILAATGSEVNGSLICTAANAVCPATAGITSVIGPVTTVTGPSISIVGAGVTQTGSTFTIGGGGSGCAIGTCVNNAGTSNQFVTQSTGTSYGFTETNTTPSNSFQFDQTAFDSFSPGHNSGQSFNGNSDWSVFSVHPGSFESATAGISQYEGCLFAHTSEGDTHCSYDYMSAVINLVNANDEGGCWKCVHIKQVGELFGPVVSATSGANSTTLLVVTGPSQAGDWSEMPANSNQFPVGLFMVNQTTGVSGPYTVSVYTPNVDGANEYTLSSGTVTPSTAYGTIASCTSSLQGNFGVYGAQNCTINVLGGTNVAGFATGSDIFQVGTKEEEDTVTSVGTLGGGTQTIVLESQYPFHTGDFIGQGGPGGQVLGPNGSTVATVDFIAGAIDSTHVIFGHCVKGSCAGNGNVVKPSANLLPNLSLSRNSGTGVVTATAPNTNFPPYFWPAGSTIVVSGATPSDLNGTFTVASNTLNLYNIVLTWTQSGATETGTGATITSPLPQIKVYGAAMICGTNNGTQGDANLCTNHATWNVADSVVGSSSSEYEAQGATIRMAQYTGIDFSFPSVGITLNDIGPVDVLYGMRVQNNPGNGVANTAYDIDGSYSQFIHSYFTPGNNGCVLCVVDANPNGGTPLPYFIFDELGSNGGILYTYSANSYTFGNNGPTGTVIAKEVTATSAASSFAAGTTIGGILPCLQNGTDCPSVSIPWATPGAIGSTTPNSGAFTTLTATSLALGSSPPTCGAGVSGCGAFAEAGTPVTAAAGVDTIRADSSHLFKLTLNGGSEFTSLMNFSTVNLASGSAGGVTGLLPNANIAHPYTAISNPITSAGGGSGTGTITCLTATCTNLRGTYSVAGGTFATGTFLTLVWPTTTTAYACTATQNGGASLGIGNSVATATGVSFTNTATILGTTVTINYQCQP